MSFNRLETTRILPAHATATATRPGDIVFIDVTTDWMSEAARADARALAERIRSRRSDASVFLRIGLLPVSTDLTALEQLADVGADGLLLTSVGGKADIQAAAALLRVVEAQSGLKDGATPLFAEVGGEPGFFLSPVSLRDASSRLKGLIFNGPMLAESTASESVNRPAGRPGAPLLLARATVVLKAREAGLACYETFEGTDPEAALAVSLADGFSGVVVADPVCSVKP